MTNDWGLDLLKTHCAEEYQKRPPLPRRLVLPRLHEADGFRPSPSEIPWLPIDLLAHHSPRSRLRPTLLFPSPVYLAAVLLNLMFRLTWLMRPLGLVEVQSHVGLANFFLQMGELIRRWIWVFIRVEWEVIKKGESHTLHDGDESEYEIIASLAAK